MAYSIKGAITQIKNQAKNWAFGEDKQQGIEELGFDIIGEETLTMSSGSTDYYVENNIAYSDQVSLQPMEYTIRGEVGELVYYKKDENNSVLGALPEKLTTVASFLPPTTKKVNQIRNTAIKISNFVNSIDNFASRIGKLNDTENKQQQALSHLHALWVNRTPVNIKTAWMTLNDYIIDNVTFSQGNTVDKTEISITFKQFRIIYSTDRIVKGVLKNGNTRYDSQAGRNEKGNKISQAFKNGFQAASGKEWPF